MIISLCTKLFSTDGAFLIDADPQSELNTVDRRLSKYLLTDGGAEFFDGGWSNSDRTITIKTADTQSALAISELGKLHQQWTLAWPGQFCAVRYKRVAIADGTATILLWGDY